MAVRSRSSYNFPGPVGPPMNLPAQRLFVHHSVTAAKNGPGPVYTVASIGVNRFGRASYSYAISLDGTIWEMQGKYRGVHTAGYNSTSLAVVLIGNYDVTRITKSQKHSIAWLYRYLVSRGYLRSGAPLFAHRQVSATACPGKYTYAAMNEIRRLTNSLPEPPPSSDGSSGGSSGGSSLLRRGSRGNDVRNWQKILHGAGLIPSSGIDGIFGPQTEGATKTFQRQLGIAVDGVVGPQTRRATKNLLDWLNRGGSLGSGSGSGSGSSPSPSGTRLLRVGVRGNDVRDWQKILHGAGLLSSSGVDGIFGPNTKQATIRFQSKLGVGADGIVGPETRRATERLLKYLSGSGSGSSSSKYVPKSLLRQGSRGGAVRDWQRILHGAGLIPRSGIDGIFGPQTHHATREFQRKLGVSVDGIVGPETYRATDKLLRYLG